MQWRLWRLKPALEFSVKIVLLEEGPPTRRQAFYHTAILPPTRIYGTSSTTPLEIWPENRSNYPPPVEFTELHRLPPSRSGRKTAPTTPLEFTELHRLPPSKYSRNIPYSLRHLDCRFSQKLLKPALPNNSHDATADDMCPNFGIRRSRRAAVLRTI